LEKVPQSAAFELDVEEREKLSAENQLAEIKSSNVTDM
jgi:hypothetical protein